MMLDIPPETGGTEGSLSWPILMDSIIILILGSFIWHEWPSNSLWLIGLYVVGIFIFSGITLLPIVIAARKAIA